VVQLPQMRQQVFTAVLHYLYTDHLKAASHWLGEIKRVAVKFRLPRLEALCTVRLSLPSLSLALAPAVSSPFYHRLASRPSCKARATRASTSPPTPPSPPSCHRW
jgi:hypothetical protein